MIGSIEGRKRLALGHAGPGKFRFSEFNSPLCVTQRDFGFSFRILGLTQAKEVDAGVFKAGHLAAQALDFGGQHGLTARLRRSIVLGGAATGACVGQALLRIVGRALSFGQAGACGLKGGPGFVFKARREGGIFLWKSGQFIAGLRQRRGGFLMRRRLAGEVDPEAQRFGFESRMRFGGDTAFCFQLCQCDPRLAEAGRSIHLGFAERCEAFAGFDAFLFANGVFA
jgi:hypothetical protein